MKVLPVLSLVVCAYILNEVTLIDLPFQLITMFLLNAQLLILNVIRCSIHSLFGFDLELAFPFERGHRLINLWLNNILLEYLVKSVLIFVYFFNVSALCLVAPTDMARRSIAMLQSEIIFSMFSRKFLLHESIISLEQ